MKNNLTKLIALVLAVMMVLPTAVFAAETTVPGTPGGTGSTGGTGTTTPATPVTPTVTTETLEIYHDAENVNHRTKTIAITNPDSVAVYFTSSKPAVASVDANGNVTGLSAGTAAIHVFQADNDALLGTVDVTVKSRVLVSIDLTDSTASHTYAVGQEFNASGLVVKALYDNGDSVRLASTAYNYSPKTALNVGNDKITVTYTEKGVTKTAYYDITVSDTLHSIIASFSGTKLDSNPKTYTEGDTLSLYAIVRYTIDGAASDMMWLDDDYEILVNGTAVASGYQLKTTDKKVSVRYGGKTSTELSITVKAKEQVYKLTTSGDYTKKAYKVGEKFDASGVTGIIYLNDVANRTLSSADLTSYIGYTFTAEDVGKTEKTFDIKVDNVTYAIKVTGLTVSKVLSNDEPTYITRVYLNQTRYEVGHEFTLRDVNRIYCRMNGTNTYIYGSPYLNYTTLSDYSAMMDLEVLTDNGRTKSARYAHILEEEDVFTEDGVDLVNLRFTFGNEYLDFTAEVGTYGISFSYYGKFIKTYSSLAAALNATLTQDPDVANIFDLSAVLDRRSIELKLGEDASLSSTYAFDPKHNVTIDLNGYDLTLYTDTIDFSRNNLYIVTVTNTAKTAGKLFYDDEDITVTLAEDDEIVFEYGENLPGILTVELDYEDDHGTVTASPKADSKGRIIVGQGSTITFTIKPDSGYEIDEVEIDGKNVKTSTSYKTTTTGATYTMSGIMKDQTFSVTFQKKSSSSSSSSSTTQTVVWNNPFTDVSSNSTYYSAVKFVYENELFKGTTTTRFSPNTTMTRAMFVTVLGRLAGVDVSKYKTSSFTDVPLNKDTEWYAPYVQWAVDFGIAQGYGNGKFGPNDEITHQQMYVFMYRYAMFVENQRVNVSGVSLSMTDRASVASWAETAVKFAQQKNFLVLSSNRVNPEGDALRWELATLLENFCYNVLGWEANAK